MPKTQSIEEIKTTLSDVVTSASQSQKRVGVRFDDITYKKGDVCRNSYEFDARNFDEAIAQGETPELLDGTYVWEIDMDKAIDTWDEIVDDEYIDKAVSAICDGSNAGRTMHIVQYDDVADYLATDVRGPLIETVAVDPVVMATIKY